ncbi:kinase-like domain-containing protein [Truncatella angustata]|uniref:Kinase-like domain-containing protein n=1 Tax=Truncatella angustata TaxID=152316 RepID=A0A9P9A499_9PEZI|nr:kinase-like domain-containing protein [Truncatella angustata]KAH6659689.1 kinase-like domain-containing protein [Truncatella angustata]KAH8194592.1 hypothetical protein TruAng_011242 [Truncatella angustata]
MTTSDQVKSNLLDETYHSILEICQWQGRKVVLKRCRHQDDPRTPSRFQNEVDALKAANTHDSIAKILDFDSQRLTIILRLESGQSLDKFVNTDMTSTLSFLECTTIWKQIAGALTYLHSQSIIHDDVKPDNIMWSSDHQRCVLIDLGAALIDMPEDYFNPSGTPNYAPPEFLSRKKNAKGDIWGLGITMLYAFGFIPLPAGEWILPHALEQGSEARKEMVEWLEKVEQLRVGLLESDPIAASMLATNLDVRISSNELSRQLESI